MDIKILSPKLVGTYIDYDSEEKLSDIPDSVFSLNEFLASAIFTSQEKLKQLQLLVDQGNYLLKLMDSYLILKTPLDEFKSNTFILVEGMKSLTKVVNDPLGAEFYDEDYGQALRHLYAMYPEKYYLEAEEFDVFCQVYDQLDRKKRYTYNPDNMYEPSKIFFKMIVDKAISHFLHATEVEIGNLLTGSIFFSNRKQRAAFVVDPAIYQVLNGGFRKSIQCNNTFVITDEDGFKRVLSFYNDMSKFLVQIREASSMIVNQIMQNDSNSTVKIERPSQENMEDDLEDIQDEKIRRDIRDLEKMYPKFKKHRKLMLERGVIYIDKDGLYWNGKYKQIGFALFWAYCANWKIQEWKPITQCFTTTFNLNSLKSEKCKRNLRSQAWINLKDTLNIM